MIARDLPVSIGVILPVAAFVCGVVPSASGHMVRDLSVLLPDCSAFVAAHAAADLPSTIISPRSEQSALFAVPDARHQNSHRGGAISVLRSFRLAIGDKPSGPMFDQHGGLGFVAVLTTGSRPALCGPLDVTVTDDNFSSGGLWQHGDSDGAGVDSAALFVRRNTLPSVAASFICEGSGGPFARGAKYKNTGTLLYDFNVKDPSEPCVSRRCGTARSQGSWRHRRLLRRGFQLQRFPCLRLGARILA